MKVCIVTTAFPRWPGDDRGAFILHAAQSLVKRGARVKVIAIHSPGSQHREMIGDIEVIRPGYLPEKMEILQKEGGGLPVVWKKNPFALLAVIPFGIVHTLATAWYARDCDVIHANWTLSGFTTWIASVFHRRPFVVTIHGSDIYQTRKMALVRWLSGIALRGAKRVISVSRDLARCATDLGVPANAITVIPDGIDVDLFHPQDAPREHTILFVGSLIPRKGVIHLIRALPEICKALPNLHLLIAGEGPQEPILKEEVQHLNLAENVTFLGAVSQEQISRLMRSTKLFVLPSLEEGLGVVLLEAIASGTPCVGSNIGGIPDIIVQEVGRLVPPGDPQALAQAVIQMLANETAWASMSNAARERAVEIFRWEKIADDLLCVYQESFV